MRSELPTILEDFEISIQRRGLLLAGVDAKGIPRRWEDPAVIDVKLIAQSIVPMPYRFWVERVAFIQYGYTLRAALSPIAGALTDEVLDEVRTHVIAGGRRHSMKGDL